MATTIRETHNGSRQLEREIAQTRLFAERALFVDYVYRKGVLCVAVVLLAALIYRFLAARMARAVRGKTNEKGN